MPPGPQNNSPSLNIMSFSKFHIHGLRLSLTINKEIDKSLNVRDLYCIKLLQPRYSK